jgi:hypothetical protein
MCLPSSFKAKKGRVNFTKSLLKNIVSVIVYMPDHLCVLAVRVPGCFYSRRYQISREVVGLERGPLSLVGKTEELLKLKVAAPV